jgi:hypothetical protein
MTICESRIERGGLAHSAALAAFIQTSAAVSVGLQSSAAALPDIFALCSYKADARRALAAQLAPVVTAGGAVRGINSLGLPRILALSARAPGHLQLTRFDATGQPWGDSLYTNAQSAAEDLLQDIEPSTLEVREP